MCDRNAKSECILKKIRALVFEFICERTAKFHEKMLFDSRVINVRIPMTKYTALITAVTCPEGCYVDAITVSVNNKHGVFRRRSSFN